MIKKSGGNIELIQEVDASLGIRFGEVLGPLKAILHQMLCTLALETGVVQMLIGLITMVATRILTRGRSSYRIYGRRGQNTRGWGNMGPLV